MKVYRLVIYDFYYLQFSFLLKNILTSLTVDFNFNFIITIMRHINSINEIIALGCGIVITIRFLFCRFSAPAALTCF